MACKDILARPVHLPPEDYCGRKQLRANPNAGITCFVPTFSVKNTPPLTQLHPSNGAVRPGILWPIRPQTSKHLSKEEFKCSWRITPFTSSWNMNESLEQSKRSSFFLSIHTTVWNASKRLDLFGKITFKLTSSHFLSLSLFCSRKQPKPRHNFNYDLKKS